jgi:capsular polysaccharide biosynthesis protein
MQQRSDDGNGGALLWNAETKRRVQADFDNSIAAANDLTHAAFKMLDGSRTPDSAHLLRAFLLGGGDHADATRYRLSEVTDLVGRRAGLLAEDERFFRHPWLPRRDAVERLCPDLTRLLFAERDNTALQAVPLLDRCPNEIRDPGFPRPLGHMIGQPRRPGLVAYVTDDARAYVHPFQYQVLSADGAGMWLSASPRFLTRASVPDLAVERLARTIVVVQDRFTFSNVSHFLYDGITRILHYVRHCGLAGDELFVLGGIPAEYQALVCATLCRHLGIGLDAVLFPDRPRLLVGRRCVWFSDQIEAHSFPAQMAHPHSITALSALCAQVPVPAGPARRLYISRADAAQRRVANEPALIEALSAHDFVPVELGNRPAAEQISLFKGAEFIIGPHGQGLAHLVMGGRLGRMIELFHPDNGNDCYALMARTAGVHYDWVVGTAVPDTPGDFLIDIERVLALVAVTDAPIDKPSLRKAANLLPASASFTGFVGPRGEAPVLAAAQMIWGQQAVAHDAAGGGEAGGWPHIEIAPGQRYTLSCWVWLPSGGEIGAVELAFGDWPGQIRRVADPGAREVWQRIVTTVTSPAVQRGHPALRIDGTGVERVLSTCWQLERGEHATAYVATA